MNNKPLLLRPSGKDYLWGGRRLNDEFEKGIDLSPLAETWECSTHPEGPCYVVGGEYDGKELAAVLREHPEYLGERHKGETELPILIKFIDAKKDLSVQVHPTDDYAKSMKMVSLARRRCGMFWMPAKMPNSSMVWVRTVPKKKCGQRLSRAR